MPSIVYTNTGKFDGLNKFLNSGGKIATALRNARVQSLAQQGVTALQKATPKRSGKTADSWSYEIEDDGNAITIFWTNSNVENYVNIASIIQYGHATRTGGYVEGIDYINPALQPIFEKITNEVWRAVVSL